ncbi:CU044_2847 family protein [Streptomyces sp. NPDC057543]|uniref:CU044_2847 family protein n=1 Tax=Streptomyces sp. NPDC057543 TaxID=3346163 RepID=UPI0036B57A73
MSSHQLIRIPLTNSTGDAESTSVLAEVDATTSGVARAGRAGDAAATAVRSLSETFDQVRGAVETALSRLTSLSVQPKSVELEVGVKFSAEAGAVIAKTATEGNVVLRLTWERPNTEPTPYPDGEPVADSATPETR